MIWSTLTSLADQRISIEHGNPLINYYLEDSEGFKFSNMQATVAINSEFDPGDEEIQVLPQHLFFEYYLLKNNITDIDKYLNSTSHPAALPKGKYTISASADYSKGKEIMQLLTGLEIVIE
ncbi:hypothetical protein D3C78_1524090 [compost metagenome]